MRWSLIISILVLIPWVPSARAYPVTEGASRAELVSTYGYPLSQAKTGDREILNYREGSVVLEKGRVVEFRCTRGEPPLSRRLMPAPVQPAPKPMLSRPPEKAPVRELLGVMTANNIPEGYFVTTGNYTEEALAFKTPNLHLLSGHDVLTRFNALTPTDHQKVVQHAFRGDFETLTCPSCDERMSLLW